MTMKKIKPQYGKVVAPVVKSGEETEVLNADLKGTELIEGAAEEKSSDAKKKATAIKGNDTSTTKEKTASGVTSEPNPFLQTKEVFGKARLTKIGYRMRSDYVEILDIIKKIKKGGYTLEAVLDDALTFYFDNSEDGKEAIRKAEIFYS